jgi:hypothetical protein
LNSNFPAPAPTAGEDWRSLSPRGSARCSRSGSMEPGSGEAPAAGPWGGGDTSGPRPLSALPSINERQVGWFAPLYKLPS